MNDRPSTMRSCARRSVTFASTRRPPTAPRGIARWRLLEKQAVDKLEATERALRWLVARGQRGGLSSRDGAALSAGAGRRRAAPGGGSVVAGYTAVAAAGKSLERALNAKLADDRSLEALLGRPARAVLVRTEDFEPGNLASVIQRRGSRSSSTGWTSTKRCARPGRRSATTTAAATSPSICTSC